MKRKFLKKIFSIILMSTLLLTVYPNPVYAEEVMESPIIDLDEDVENQYEDVENQYEDSGEDIESQEENLIGKTEVQGLNFEEEEKSRSVDLNEDRIEILDAEQLFELASFVNEGNALSGKTVVLKNDIDLSVYDNWTPIGTLQIENQLQCKGIHAFDGTFDGNGHVISGLKINSKESGSALFGYSTGVLKDFTVEGEIEGNSYTAGVVAYGCGEITNVINRVRITAKGNCVGGILASAMGNIAIKNCHNEAEITNNGEASEKSTGRMAGIVGCIDTGYDDSIILNCSNTANITGYQYVAGIVGICAADAQIQACYNSGGIRGVSFGKVYIGGIVGKLGAGTIDSCYNIGTITDTPWANGNIRAVGGIVGSEENHVQGTAISNCYNAGVITLDTSKMAYEVKYIYECGNISGGHYPTYMNDMGYSNCYYLKGTFPIQDETHENYKYWCDNYKENHYWIDTTDIIGCTEEQLMDVDLGDYFITVDSYPILYWQIEGAELPEIKKYNIVSSVTGGNATINIVEKAEEKSTVKFTISDIESGKDISKIKITDISGKEITLSEVNGEYSFTMPSRNVMIEVRLENQIGENVKSYSMTLPKDLDAIWNLTISSSYYNDGKIKAGSTVTVIVDKKDKAVTTSFKGIKVKANTETIKVTERIVTESEGAKVHAEYTFTMPEADVQVELEQIYSEFTVNVQKEENVTKIKSYSREEMENIGKNNTRAYYSGWSTEKEPFIGVAEKYVTLEQILSDCNLKFSKGDILKVTGSDGFSQMYSYESLMETPRYYYSDIIQNGVNAKEKAEFSPIFTISANMTDNKMQDIDELVCDTICTYRFAFGQSEEELHSSKKIVDAMPKNLVGMTIVYGAENTSEKYKSGDVNNDGKVNLQDVILLQQYIAKWENVEINEDAADVTGDGKVTLLDLVKVQQYIAKIISQF